MRTLLTRFITAAVCLLSSAVSAQTLTTEQMEQLQFRHIGPIGNRLISVTGVPADPMTYYVGAASGGIWKSSDGGLKWKPVFDGQRVHSIGALALAPSEPEVVYAGTGESFIRSNVSIGNGMWKSTDGGTNWSHLGLENTGRISRIVVHPSCTSRHWAMPTPHNKSAVSTNPSMAVTAGHRSCMSMKTPAPRT